MRVHDDLDLPARQSSGPAKNKDAKADVEHALANPKQASVQTMLEVQRLAGNSGVNQLLQRAEDDSAGQRSPVLDVVGKSGGNPLPEELRSEMEGRLGGDFADVKFHTDDRASESARAVQANAYTVGNDVVVRQDRWSPESEKGKETIAHELTHVMQQRAGPVAGTSQGNGISVSDPGDPFEKAAERNAQQAMAAPAATASAQLQREAAPEEEEEAQMQREAAPEEEEEAQLQREAAPEEEEEAQMQRGVQRHADHAEEATPTTA
jgi:hypothetical protein